TAPMAAGAEQLQRTVVLRRRLVVGIDHDRWRRASPLRHRPSPSGDRRSATLAGRSPPAGRLSPSQISSAAACSRARTNVRRPSSGLKALPLRVLAEANAASAADLALASSRIYSNLPPAGLAAVATRSAVSPRRPAPMPARCRVQIRTRSI